MLELDPNLTFEPLLTEDVSVLMPSNHPLSQKQEIYLADFKDEKLLLSGFVSQLSNSFRKVAYRSRGHTANWFSGNSIIGLKRICSKQKLRDRSHP